MSAESNKDAQANGKGDELKELDGIAVRVGGAMVAWFADPEHAQEWARENYFGQWLMSPCSIPNKPAFTPEQIQRARAEAEKMLELLEPGRIAD